MSDRIAVMRGGLFEQVGSPSEVYDRPKTAYVASFVGSANIIEGVCAYKDGKVFLDYGGDIVPVDPLDKTPQEGERITAAVRSEQIQFTDGEGIKCTVKEKSFAAGMLRIALETKTGKEIVARRHGIDYQLNAGDNVTISWAPDAAVLVEGEDTDEK